MTRPTEPAPAPPECRPQVGKTTPSGTDQRPPWACALGCGITSLTTGPCPVPDLRGVTTPCSGKGVLTGFSPSREPQLGLRDQGPTAWEGQA